MGVSQHKENRRTREAPSRYGAGLFLGIMMTVSATLMLIMRFTALEIDDVVLSVNDGPAGVISKLMLLAGGLMILIVARDIYLNKFFLEDIFDDLDLSHMDSFLTTILCTIAAVILLFTKHRSIVKTLIISSLVFADMSGRRVRRPAAPRGPIRLRYRELCHRSAVADVRGDAHREPADLMV